MDLFDYARDVNTKKESPLASRLRPKTLDEVVGQEHIIAKDKLLYRAIKADKISSVIFYGPPGTGKTTLAKVIANTTSSKFTQLNATVSGKKDMQDVVAKAKDELAMTGKKTILFILKLPLEYAINMKISAVTSITISLNNLNRFHKQYLNSDKILN